MKKILLTLLSLISVLSAFAAEIPSSVMQRIYNEVRTPYKYGMVVAPADNYRFIMEKTDWTDEDMRRGWHLLTTYYIGIPRDASSPIRTKDGT